MYSISNIEKLKSTLFIFVLITKSWALILLNNHPTKISLLAFLWYHKGWIPISFTPSPVSWCMSFAYLATWWILLMRYKKTLQCSFLYISQIEIKILFTHLPEFFAYKSHLLKYNIPTIVLLYMFYIYRHKSKYLSHSNYIFRLSLTIESNK